MSTLLNLIKYSWIKFIFFAILISLLSLIIHISLIMILPFSAGEGNINRLSGLPSHKTTIINTSKNENYLPLNSDPASVLAICPYNLASGPVRVIAGTGDEILTISFHAFDGRVFYALSDRAAQRNVINIVLMTRLQLDEALGTDDQDDIQNDVRILSPVQRGLVVVRVLALQSSEKISAEQRASAFHCKPDTNALEN
ncbi:MAG: hypothetical protein ACRCTD_04455 [Beijerinckiaceae bacterium]